MTSLTKHHPCEEDRENVGYNVFNPVIVETSPGQRVIMFMMDLVYLFVDLFVVE